MRPIHVAQLDKPRPILVLTPEVARPVLANVTVAPITTRVRSLAVEVSVGVINGLGEPFVVGCDNVQTIPVNALGRLVGYLFDEEERLLTEAMLAAFDIT